MPPPMPHEVPRKLTYEDYRRLPEDGLRHEILDGVHVVSPAPTWSHQDLVKNLLFLLETWCRSTGAGEVQVAPLDVLLSEHDVLNPDLLYISAANAEVIHPAHVRGAPDLVVEVLSPSTRRRDLTTKRERYALGGVQEYWVVDPEAERIEVFRLQGQELEKVDELWLAKAEVVTSPLPPGFQAPLAEVFRD